MKLQIFEKLRRMAKKINFYALKEKERKKWGIIALL